MTTASATQSSTLLIDEELPYLAAGKPAAHRIRVYETDSWATLVITDSSKKMPASVLPTVLNHL